MSEQQISENRKNRIYELQTENDQLREALRQIKNELGVPDDSYPAPVANAVEIADRALGDTPDER